MTNSEGDRFELYDLRVEVIAPEGQKIWCGAKPGDRFELRGEMLHLPPGQGFSIYSLAALLPLLPAKQRPSAPSDWMTTDDEVACPDPNCPCRFRIIKDGQAVLQARRDDRRAASRSPEVVKLARCSLAPRLRNLAGDPRRLAAGRRTRAGGACCRHRRSHRQLRGRDRHLRLRRHLYRRRGNHRRLSPGILPPPWRRGSGSSQGAHQMRARSRPARKRRPGLCALDRRPVAEAALRASGSISFSCTGGTTPSPAAWRQPSGSTSCAAKARSVSSAPPISTPPIPRNWWRRACPSPACRCSIPSSMTAPSRGSADFCRKHGISLLCYGSVAGGFLADRWLGKPEPPPPFANRSLAKYKLIIDDFGGWDLFQDLLQVLRAVANRHATDIASVASR